MGLILVTPPTEWPVSLDEAKAQLRVTSDAEDALIEGYIRAATKYVEQTLSVSISEQQWQLTLDSFTDTIELPRGPVTEIDSVEYVDVDGATQTVDGDIYSIDLFSRSQWLVLNSDETWPDTLSAVNTVIVTYTAGMEQVPDDLKHAILLLIGAWHQNRSGLSERQVHAAPLAVEALLQGHRFIFV